MKKILYLTLISLSVISCKKSEEADVNINNIYGQWTLIRRSGGFAFTDKQFTDPAIAVEIKADNSLTNYSREVYWGSYNFNLQMGSGRYGKSVYDIVPSGGFYSMSVLTAKRDTLKLAEDGDDMYTYVFTRHK